MNYLYKPTCIFLLGLIVLLVQCKSDGNVIPKSSAKTLDTPTIDGLVGITAAFDATISSYTVTVPGGTDITTVKLNFSLPAGATAKPASGSVQNFTNPVTYTVTAEDGSTQVFTVRVVHKTTWATNQDRYDAIRIRAQKIAGVTVSTAIPNVALFATNATIIDAEAAYFINSADFTQAYSDTKTIGWRAIDKAKLVMYSVFLTKATGELRVDKGTDVTFDATGNLYSYKPYWAFWALIYSK